MRNATDSHDPADLGELERSILRLVWQHGELTAEQVRQELSRPLKESTVRTVLRRLEEKGYVSHTATNRKFLYHPVEAQQLVAARAVQRIIDWFCDGSVEALLVGMVDSKVLGPRRTETACHPNRGSEEGKEATMTVILESALRTAFTTALVWSTLRLFRVTHVVPQKIAWCLVLVTAMAMPSLIRRQPIKLPAPLVLRTDWVRGHLPKPQRLPESFRITEPTAITLAPPERTGYAGSHSSWHIVRLYSWIAVSYWAICSILVLRMFLGLALATRVWRGLDLSTNACFRIRWFGVAARLALHAPSASVSCCPPRLIRGDR